MWQTFVKFWLSRLPMMRTFDFVNVMEISMCRDSSYIQPKTSVKDFRFPQGCRIRFRCVSELVASHGS
jgi:hypothetical protein